MTTTPPAARPKSPPSTRQTHRREGAKRMNNQISTYGSTMEDTQDEDFTPAKKKGRVHEPSDSSYQTSSLGRETSATVANESMEREETPHDGLSYLFESSQEPQPEVDDREAALIITPKRKAPVIRRPRAKKTIPPKNNKRQYGRAAIRKEQAQPPQTSSVEHRANSSQFLAPQSKTKEPSGTRQGGDDTLQHNGAPAEPRSPTPITNGNGLRGSVSVEIRTGKPRTSEALMLLENQYLHKKVAILERGGPIKEAQLLEAEKDYLESRINLENDDLQSKISIAKETYPAVQVHRKRELAVLKQTYLKGVLDLYPRID